MSSWDLLRHVSIGQYFPAETPLHKLDVRAKLLLFGLLILAVAFTTTYTGNLIWLIIAITLTRTARLSVRYTLASLRPALPMILVLALLQLFFYTPSGDSTTTLLRLGPYVVTPSSLRLTLVSLARLVTLMMLTSLLTATTSVRELAHGIEALLSPFARFGLPAHDIGMIVVIALRFLPVLALQLEQIAKAQASRGAEWGTGNRFAIFQQVKLASALIVPLFIDAFRRAEDLALAMEARCYVAGSHRTRPTPPLTLTDHLTLWGGSAALALTFLLGQVFAPF